MTRAEELQAITDYFANMVDCVNAQGFRMRVIEGGLGMEPDPVVSDSGGSAEAFAAAQAACEDRLGPFPNPAPLSAEEWAQGYPAQVDVVDCLREKGYPVPEIPTQESWVQQQLAPSAQTWTPYDRIAGPKLTEAQRACPAREVLDVLAEAGR